MKNHVLDCAEVSCRVERLDGRKHNDQFVGHFILTKKSIIFLSFVCFMDRLSTSIMSKELIRKAMKRPGSLRLPLSEITGVNRGEAPETGPEFTVLTSEKMGNAAYTFRCAAFCGQESEDFEAVAYPFIAGQVRRMHGRPPGAPGALGLDEEFADDPRSYYCRLLDLPDDAGFEEVKAAYRELSLVWHPDRHPDRLKARTTRKMQELNEAYRWLTMN